MDRFINADVYISTGQGILGCNMFAYCNNNSVNYADSRGSIPTSASEIQQVASDGTTTEVSGETPIDGNPKNTPPNHPNYKPPKKGPRKGKNPNGNGWGWVDQEGNVWVWTPNMHGGPGWTVQKPDGGHSHAYPGGGTRTHCEAFCDYKTLEVFPATPTAAQIYATPSTALLGGCGATLILLVACEMFWNPIGGSL